MISELKCNGQVAPISVDRRALFTWNTDFDQDGFWVTIEKNGKPVFTDEVKSSLCHYEYFGEFDRLSTYRATFKCCSGEKTVSLIFASLICVLGLNVKLLDWLYRNAALVFASLAQREKFPRIKE